MGLHWSNEDCGVRALKNRLSEYLRTAQDGEPLAVTRRGVVVARLVPPEAGGESRDEALARLARAGDVRLGKPNRPDLYPPAGVCAGRGGSGSARLGPRRPLILYAESSAVLAWLLEEAGAQAAWRSLQRAESVLASDLTLIESRRTLRRLSRSIGSSLPTR